MKLSSLFLLLLFPFNFLCSQNIESLTSKELNDIAWEFRKEFPDSTIFYAQKSIKKAEQEKNNREKLRALGFIGIAYDYKGDYVNSLEQHLRVKDLALMLNDSLEYAHSLNSVGRLYYSQGDYIKAYEMYFNALGIFLGIDDQRGAAYCYNSLSELYIAQNNLVKAEEMVRKTLEIRTREKDIKGKISALIELAEIQKSSKAYIDSYESYLKAEELALTENSDVELAEIKLGVADLYLDQKNASRGLVYAQDALNLIESKSNIDLLSHILITQGKLHYLAGSYKKSEDNLLRVLEIAEGSEDLELKTDSYYYLSKIKENEGQVHDAYVWFKKYNDAKEALDNSNKARIIERLEGKIEIEKKEQENEALRIKQMRDQALLDRQYIINIAMLVGLILTSLLFIIMFIYFRRKKKDNIKLAYKNAQIATQNDSLAELNNEKDMLMNIVAHDLQSPINNIKSLMGIIESEGPLNQEQKSYAKRIHELSIAGKELIQDLLYVNDFESNTHQLSLTKIKLDEFITKTVEAHRPQTTVKQIALRFDLNCEGYVYEADQSYLQRIIDNLISNAVKFSPPAKSIYISTHKLKNEGVTVRIKDEGQGFSDQDKKQVYKKFKKLSARPTGGEQSNGLGLAIVKTLCGRLNIDISLKSELGKGSEFILALKEQST